MESFSEQGQDLFAFEQVGKSIGTFLDVGCWEPIRNNNTFGLERLGWTGMLFDCAPQWAEPCRKYRKSPFVHCDARQVDWKILLEKYEMPLGIDYLSLDVDDKPEEPFSKTLRVLKNMLSAGLSFKAITVEHDAYRLGNQPRQGIRDLLLKNGYSLFRANISCCPPDPNGAFEDWFLSCSDKLSAS